MSPLDGEIASRLLPSLPVVQRRQLGDNALCAAISAGQSHRLKVQQATERISPQQYLVPLLYVLLLGGNSLMESWLRGTVMWMKVSEYSFCRSTSKTSLPDSGDVALHGLCSFLSPLLVPNENFLLLFTIVPLS